MWSFWKRRAQKAQLRAAFGKFVSEQTLQEIEKSIDNPSHRIPIPPLEMETIGYVILQVRSETSEHIPRHLAGALDTVLKHQGIVEEIMSSIFVATFKNTRDSHTQLITALQDKLGSDVRAVHGYGEFARGNYGSQIRLTYGTIFPDISTKLEALLKLEFGAWKEA